MKYAKPYQHDYRRPKNAEDDLKKYLGIISIGEQIIGFLDESSPQTTANTVRMWSFRKPEKIKNTEKYRANTLGFYTINGNSVIRFYENSRKEDV